MGLSIVIPIYNEENAILPTIKKLLDIMEPSIEKYELVLVNDGSQDKTLDILKTYEDHLKIKILHHTNSGYGYSLKRGIKEAKYDYIAIADADQTYPLEKIPSFYDRLRQSSQKKLIVGKRKRKLRSRGFFIAILRVIANIITYGNQKIEDLNSGLRCFRKSDVVPFFPLVSDRFSFTSTTTICYILNGMDIEYIPIEYHRRDGISKIKPVRDFLNFILLIVTISLYFKPLKIVLPIGVFFFCIFIVLLASDLYGGNITDKTVLMLLLSSQIIVSSFLFDFLDKKIKILMSNIGN